MHNFYRSFFLQKPVHLGAGGNVFSTLKIFRRVYVEHPLYRLTQRVVTGEKGSVPVQQFSHYFAARRWK